MSNLCGYSSFHLARQIYAILYLPKERRKREGR
jgi:hypothetical protein